MQVQLVSQLGRAAWPTRRRAIDQRYGDALAIELETLTDAGFAAAKVSAWLDRLESRDLFDLNAIVEAGLLTTDVAALVKSQTNWTRFPTGISWPNPPSEDEWRRQLAHQTRLSISAQGAHKHVVAALRSLE